MTEKQVFIQNPLKAQALAMLFSLLPLTVFGIFVTYRNPYQPTSYLIFVVIIFCFYLLVGGTKHKVITCDLTSCEITSRSIWGTSPSFDRFLWRDVTKTKIITVPRREWVFTVEVNGVRKSILDRYHSSETDFDNLVALANRATPHLPYQWIVPESSNLKIHHRVSRNKL